MTVIDESENYIIFGGYEDLQTLEDLRKEGYRPLAIGPTGGILCEKPEKERE